MDRYMRLAATKWEERGFRTGLTIGLLAAALLAAAILTAFLHHGGTSPREEGLPVKREDCWSRWDAGQNVSVWCSDQKRLSWSWNGQDDWRYTKSLDSCRTACSNYDFPKGQTGCNYVSFKRKDSCKLWGSCTDSEWGKQGKSAMEDFDVIMYTRCTNVCPMNATRCMGRLVGFETTRSLANCLNKCETHQPAKDHIQECQWVAFDQETDECRLLADCHFTTDVWGWLSAPKRCLEFEPY